MPALGLALLALYGLLAFGVRMVVQVRRTGSTGFKGLHGGSGPVEQTFELLLAMTIVLCFVGGPILQLAGALDSVRLLEGELASILGAALAFLGILLTVVAQFAMGDAWRIGVDPSEQTELVTYGPFSIVRNPIFAAMIPALAGIALLAPNVVTLAGAALLVVAIELQTRLIEEPYLVAVHGEQYLAYATRVGRFLPGVGRLSHGCDCWSRQLGRGGFDASYDHAEDEIGSGCSHDRPARDLHGADGASGGRGGAA